MCERLREICYVGNVALQSFSDPMGEDTLAVERKLSTVPLTPEDRLVGSRPLHNPKLPPHTSQISSQKGPVVFCVEKNNGEPRVIVYGKAKSPNSADVAKFVNKIKRQS